MPKGLNVSEKERILGAMCDGIVNLDSEAVQDSVRKALNYGISPVEIMTEGAFRGLDLIGERFEKREYFLAELMVSGEIVKETLQLLKPHIKKEDVASTGIVIIGTVEGDVHDIGKNIVALFLESRGFEVIDLGVDVPPGNFVQAVKEHGPQILAMSALLTHSAPVMGVVTSELEKAGLREKVKVLIGGAPITPEFAERIGADYAAKDALDGVSKCLEWVRRGSER